MKSDKVLVEIIDHMAIVTLNEPDSLNALTNELKKQLMNELDVIEKNDQIKCVVLTGKGRAFCAGGDVKAMQEDYEPQKIQQSMDVSRQIINKIRTMPKIVVAAVHGYAAGAGMSLALAADLIFAEARTKFILSFKNVGLIPDLGLHYHLPRKVGYWKAKEWMWSGKTLTADEAVDYGFVLEAVENNQVLERAVEYTNKLAEGPINAYIHSKLLMNESHDMTLDQVMNNDNSLQTIIRGTDEHHHFLANFFNRRQ